MEILIASGNLHKVQELERALPGPRLRRPQDLGLTFSHEETAHTFWENSLGKAKSLQALAPESWILADDSGLCIQALGGAPGVYSARYGRETAGRDLSDQEKNLLVLQQLSGVQDRRAHFVCNLTLLGPGDKLFIFQETWPGEIAHQELGQGGFGYDPIFWLSDLGRSCAQLSPEEKNRLSHRGRAVARLNALISNLETQP